MENGFNDILLNEFKHVWLIHLEPIQVNHALYPCIKHTYQHKYNNLNSILYTHTHTRAIYVYFAIAIHRQLQLHIV